MPTQVKAPPGTTWSSSSVGTAPDSGVYGAHYDVHRWFIEMGIYDWQLNHHGADGLVFVFANDSDAAIFLLRWG